MDKVLWEDVDPIVVSEKEFLDIFGSSSDEETEFYGFSENELGLKEFRNVLSPNKLKLQDDFYMQLFLPHHRRNRDLVPDKPQECLHNVKRVLELDKPATSQNEPKQIAQSLKKPLLSNSKFENDNPYAKQYKSYRRDRTKSVPLPCQKVVEGHKDEKLSVEKNAKLDMPSKAAPDSREATKSSQILSNEKQNLKMKIQYQSHVRPKRKVIVPERDDYVYGITLPSKRRTQAMSPTVITNVKILKSDEDISTSESPGTGGRKENRTSDGFESHEESTYKDYFKVHVEDMSKQINEENMEQSNDPLSLEIQNEQAYLEMRSKRKRRFKNFRGTETEYLRAVCSDLISSGVESPQDAARSSSEPVSNEPVKDDADAGSIVTNVSSLDADANAHVELDKSVSLEIAGKDWESLSSQTKVPENGIRLSSTVASTNDIENDKGDYPEIGAQKAMETKEEGPRRARLQKSKHEVEENARESSVTGKKIESSITPKENKASNKDNGANNVRESRRKERKSASFKPKDINLTDSWFVTSSMVTKRTASQDKNRNAPKAASDSTDTRRIRSASNSNVDVRSSVPSSKTRDPPTVGKFVPAENRKSMTRRRRLKNVSGDVYYADGLSKVNDEFGKNSETGGFSQRPSTILGDGKSLVDSSSKTKSNDSSHSRIFFSSMFNSSKEECTASKGEKMETGSLSKVSVEVTRVDSSMSTGIALNACTNENGTVADSKQNSTSSSGVVEKLLNDPDRGFFDSFRTKTQEVALVNDQSGFPNNEVANFDILRGGTVGEGSHRIVDWDVVKSGGQSREGGKSYKKERINADEEASALEVKVSTPIEMIEGRPLVASSPKAAEDSRVVGEDEIQLSSADSEVASKRPDSNLTQVKLGDDAGGGKICEKHTCKDREDFRERGIVDLTKIGRKINRRFSKINDKDAKNLKSGKSFFINAPVDDKEKQVTVRPVKPGVKKGSKNLEDYESDTEIDITALDKDNSYEKEDSGKDTKVKRKIYTVVRKIRRTEITADGKKITKIIKQIVKKVCPVTNDQSGASAPAAKRRAAIEKAVKSGDNLAEKPVKNESKVPADGTVKSVSNQRCGKCQGCLRKDDCKHCEACRRKKETSAKLNIICRMRKCREKDKKSEKDWRNEDQKEKRRTQKRLNARHKTIVPRREEISVKSLKKSKKYAENDETQLSAVSARPVKSKAKPKNCKSRLKDMDLLDNVYAPGFRLRSKKMEVVKTKPNRILKQVKYSGMEPKVKLPWPEEQDEQSVCSSGNFFCITSPIDIATKELCFHCGSGGFSKMVTCINCSEVYHEFCIEIDPLDEARWFCDRCKRCNVCGYKDNLLMCDKCHDCYHAECLGPFYHRETEGVDDSWVCAKCVKCEKCGAKVPGKRKESKWMSDFTLCEECDAKIERGQYCSICENVYAENDYDTKMMYCPKCCKWIHMECEGLNADEYECLAELPEEIPYVCKLCHSSKIWPRWYQEVREEIQAGFEKTYYEIIGSTDMKIVNKHLPEFKNSEVQQVLDDIFKRIQDHGFSTVEQFVTTMKIFIQKLSDMIDGVLPTQIIYDLTLLLTKQTKSMFSWTENLFKTPKSPCVKKVLIEKHVTERTEVPDAILNAIAFDHPYNQVKTDDSVTNRGESGKDDLGGPDDNNIFERLLCREKGFVELATENENIECMSSKLPLLLPNDPSNIAEKVAASKFQDEKSDEDTRSELASEKCDTMDTDDVVSSSKNSVFEDDNSQDGGDDASLRAKIRTAKHVDDRRCLLCSQYGDEHEKDSGRILNAGVNEWVHVNCALWSAEVYENDAGLLQNVHVAISRGQKLQCSTCQQWGATVGCCTSSCPSNYHFMCARNNDVIFQNDKLVFCPKHKHKSKNEVILDEDGFVVARPVMVDLSRVSNQKKFAVDRHPDSITIYSGSMIIHRLGRLTESSNREEVLVPIGYRASRLFWSSNDTSKRCKYFFSIDETPVISKTVEEKEIVVLGGTTIRHNAQQVKRKELSSRGEVPQSLHKRRKVFASPLDNKLDIKTTSFSIASTNVGPLFSSPTPFSSRPLKIGKDPFEKSHNAKDRQVPSELFASLSVTQDVTSVNTCVALQPIVNRPSRSFYHKISPHKIIPQPGGLFTTPYEVPTNTLKSTNISPKPRLIQPKLRYEVLPTVLQPDVSGDNAKRPILPKYDPPVVAIARHLQCHLNSNPQMVNYVGDATLQGLHQVLGMAYQYPVSRVPVHVDSGCAMMPCYTLNLPDTFWGTFAGQTQSILPNHHFQAQDKPRIIRKREKADSSCQTDVEEKHVVIDVTCNVGKPKTPGEQSSDNQISKQTKKRLDMDLAYDQCVQKFSSVHEENNDTVVNSHIDEKKGNYVGDTNTCVGSDSQRRTECSSVNSLHTSPDGLKLPNIRNLIDGFSRTAELDAKKGCNRTETRTVNSDDVSPLSLQNVPELSCLQAAAHLAKLMPEIFEEKQSTPNTAMSSSERVYSHSGDPLNSINIDSVAHNVTNASIADNVASVTDVTSITDVTNANDVTSSTDAADGSIVPAAATASSVLVADFKPDGKKNRKWYQKRIKKLLGNEKQQKSRLRVTVKNEDGLFIAGASIQGVWKQIIERLNESRIDQKLPALLHNENEAFDFFGLTKFPTLYIAEQLPGGHKCRKYKFQYHLPCTADEDKELPLNPHGCARADVYTRRHPSDMFAWLASPYRTLPEYVDDGGDDTETSKTASDLPLSMRFRQLKNKVKDHVGVYRSLIDGRGLFCKQQIEASEMVIEYAGSVIRATLTDKRENYYEGKGYGCYMFRIDDTFVVDATLYGNEARFINHSCEPNCYSRIVSVDGEKHIVIFAARRIFPGEELTYDYKFPFEEEKIPCHCGSKKCRKYLN